MSTAQLTTAGSRICGQHQVYNIPKANKELVPFLERITSTTVHYVHSIGQTQMISGAISIS